MSQLNSYKVIRSLASGSFAKVKLAEHIVTGSKVAMKILSKQSLQKRRLLKKVESELSILKSLSHPHILTLFDYISTVGNIVIVTEYLPGGDLYNLIDREGKLSESRARSIFSQLISALEYCHSQRIAHRDIKPDNILLDPKGTVKLADFGLSALFSDGDFLHTSCGSPNYAAPEIVKGTIYAGPEVDIWSSGVLLYTMCAGALPFDEPNLPLLFAKIKTANFKIPGHFSENLQDLITRMLDPDPISRLTLQQIKRHPWVLSTVVYKKEKHTVNHSTLQEILKCQQFSSYTPEEARQDIETGKHSALTVAYKILSNCKQKYLSEWELPLFKDGTDTRASSQFGDEESSLTPHNWVFGFRMPFLDSKALLEVFRNEGFCWKQKERFIFKHGQIGIKLAMKVYKFHNSFVLEFQVLKGYTLPNFDVLSRIFASIRNTNQIN